MAKVIDSRPTKRKKLSKEEARHEEVKKARKEAIKIAADAITAKLGSALFEPHPSFPTQEEFNK